MGIKVNGEEVVFGSEIVIEYDTDSALGKITLVAGNYGLELHAEGAPDSELVFDLFPAKHPDLYGGIVCNVLLYGGDLEDPLAIFSMNKAGSHLEARANKTDDENTITLVGEGR